MISLSIVMFLWGRGIGMGKLWMDHMMPYLPIQRLVGKWTMCYTCLEIGCVLSSIVGPMVSIVLFHSVWRHGLDHAYFAHHYLYWFCHGICQYHYDDVLL